MHVIAARNVNDAYRRGLRLLYAEGQLSPSRNGDVLRVDDPVTTVYDHPTERVLFSAQRNANPFFHLIESLWMLNGRNDTRTLTQFIPRMAEFSDDGMTFHGAYGHRWRRWALPNHRDPSGRTPELDQLDVAVRMLKQNSADRRVVIGMWDPALDLGIASKDIPCNDLIKLRITNGALDLHVYCRSNDAIWGCYGANAVQFSVLQEYLAARIGCSVGRYWQISGDFHAYQTQPYRWSTFWPLDPDINFATDGLVDPSDMDWTDDDLLFQNPYDLTIAPIRPYPLVTMPDLFDAELTRTVSQIASMAEFPLFPVYARGRQYLIEENLYGNQFFPHVVIPMCVAFLVHQRGDTPSAIGLLSDLNTAMLERYGYTIDWCTAGEQWLNRSFAHRQEANRHRPSLFPAPSPSTAPTL
jgi:hypothetical protein